MRLPCPPLRFRRPPVGLPVEGEDAISAPVTEDEVVVEKRPVTKEEIRIRKDVVEDTEVDVEDATERRNR